LRTTAVHRFEIARRQRSSWLVGAALVFVALLQVNCSGTSRAASAGSLGAATQQGVTVRVTAVLADTTETVLAVELAGQDSLGNMAAALGRPELRDSAGRGYAAVSLVPDATNPRLQTWTFAPLASDASGLTLALDGVQFWQRPSNPAAAPDSVLKEANTVRVKFTVPIAWRGPPGEVVRRTVGGGESAFGRGRLVVDSVTSGPTGSVVAGHIEGFTMDEVPEMQLYPPALVLADGSTLAAVGGRSGFGEQRQQFEFRFPQAQLDGATLTLPFRVSEHPHDVAVAAALQSSVGSEAQVRIALQ
jgi:hypothetical protein